MKWQSKCEEPASGIFFPLSVLKSSKDDSERGKCLNSPGKAYPAHQLGRELTAVKRRGMARTSFSKSYQNIPLTLFKVQGFYCQNPQAKQKQMQSAACLLIAHAVLEHRAQKNLLHWTPLERMPVIPGTETSRGSQLRFCWFMPGFLIFCVFRGVSFAEQGILERYEKPLGNFNSLLTKIFLVTEWA